MNEKANDEKPLPPKPPGYGPNPKYLLSNFKLPSGDEMRRIIEKQHAEEREEGLRMERALAARRADRNVPEVVGGQRP